MRKAGPGPDLPPPVLHRLAMYSSLRGFSEHEALASEDMEALRRLPRRSRAFIARTRPEVARAVEAAFRPAPVPTVDAW